MSTLVSALNTSVTATLEPKSESFNGLKGVLSNRLAYHILFWIVLFVFNAAYITYIEKEWQITLYNFLLRVPFIIACCYINLYVLLPRYFYKGNLVLYGVLLSAVILSINAINLSLLEATVNTAICPKSYESHATFTSSNFIYKAFYLTSIIGLTSGIKLSKGYLLEKQKADAIEKEKLQTELSLLKSQIHPHFFFNTLNNLYALTLKKSDLAPDMLLKLSDLMSYNLYEAEGTHVSLKKEIQHIQNYIELESLRFGNKMKVEFTVNGLQDDRQIPPLIFLPFIENCFKHAGSKQPGFSIVIDLTIQNDTITLHTKNPFINEEKAFSKKGGLGLKNVQRRLELLYDDRYHLETESSDGFFIATLQIPLL